MKHILGVVASLSYNLETEEKDYMSKILVTEDIIDWLDSHDVRIDSFGRKVYICNEIEYIYLGPKIEVDVELFNNGVEYTA